MQDLVGIDQYVRSATLIWVRVNQRDTRESGRTLDRGWGHGITDQLGVVELDDRRRDGVCSWRDWEIKLAIGVL